MYRKYEISSEVYCLDNSKSKLINKTMNYEVFIVKQHPIFRFNWNYDYKDTVIVTWNLFQQDSNSIYLRIS